MQSKDCEELVQVCLSMEMLEFCEVNPGRVWEAILAASYAQHVSRVLHILVEVNRAVACN